MKPEAVGRCGACCRAERQHLRRRRPGYLYRAQESSFPTYSGSAATFRPVHEPADLMWDSVAKT
jgi:hypothetical protein